MLCDYFGNPWIGMFIKTNNEITLVPNDATEKLCDLLHDTLKTEIVKMSVAGSNLLGVYIAMNSHGVVLPNVASADEVAVLKKYGLNVYISNEKLNTHGNNIVVNDKLGLVNKKISKTERKKIEDTLSVELIEKTIAGYSTVGSTCIATNKGFLVHYGSTNVELEELRKLLKLDGDRGSINMGVGFVSRGLIANEKGYVAGSLTSGFELARVHSALGF
jgi:translation initiation factor 6